jgi:hypothetical protein
MELLEKIKDRFFNSVIAHRTEGYKANRKMMNFEAAKTFGIIYDSTISGSDIAVTKIAESLRNKGKEVSVFAFLNDKKVEQKDDVVIFNANDINWYGVPKSDKVLQFCDRKLDVILCAIPTPNRPLEYIGHFSKALCRVGVFNEGNNDFELMVNVPENTAIPKVLEQMIQLLNQIKL